MKATIITSMKDLESFLTHHKYSPKHYDLGQVTGIIKETDQGNAQAEEAMKEQLNSFQDRISALKEKIAGARSERQTRTACSKTENFSMTRCRRTSTPCESKIPEPTKLSKMPELTP